MSILAPLALLALACSDSHREARPPVARLAAGRSDTIIVNLDIPRLLPVHALDSAGQAIAGTPIRFERIAGDTMPLTSEGSLACPHRADLTVRATLDQLSTDFTVLCRPVRYVRLDGPVQFVLGDSALSQPLVIALSAYDAERRAVAELAGYLEVLDTGKALIHGMEVSPRSRGVTLLSARIGGAEGRAGVHIYQRLESITALDTVLRVPKRQRQFAVPITLAPGETVRHPMPPGGWMLSIQPAQRGEPKGFEVRVEGAKCQLNLLNDPGRLGCHTDPGAVVVVSRARAARGGTALSGYLLVRGFGE